MKNRNDESQREPRQSGTHINGPLLVVFEGIDGSGKSTQARLLAERLEKQGVGVVLTSEPSTGTIGKVIRSLRERPSLEEEIQLFTEDRRDHVQTFIRPALERGLVVICDRYIYSSAAYQGARGADPQSIIIRNLSFAPAPDIIFMLDCSIDTCLARISRGRPLGHSLFEIRENLQAVEEIYRGLRDSLIRRIPAEGSIAEIHERVMDALKA